MNLVIRYATESLVKDLIHVVSEGTQHVFAGKLDVGVGIQL